MPSRSRHRQPSRALEGDGGRVRIIGGRLRGSILTFPPGPAVRPTPGRVRETLFNWLSDDLPGARCLDLFAGSGALGIEAASRGAAEVVLVERDRVLAAGLRDTVARLQPQSVEVVETDGLAWLARTQRCFDLVFLDPPFGGDHVVRALDRLAVPGRLAPRGRVYVETRIDGPPLPDPWTPERTRAAGQVRYHLAALARIGSVANPETDSGSP